MSARVSGATVAALAIGVLGILMGGCGGSDSNDQAAQEASVNRAASADGFPDSKTCPEKSPSFSVDLKVLNLIPWAIKMNAGDYTCDDWSGVSTPGRELNDQVVGSGETRTFRLEPRKYRTRNWTMQFGTDGGGVYGRADFTMPQTSLEGSYVKPLRPNVGERQYFRTGDPVEWCWFAPLNTINTNLAPQTPVKNFRPQDQMTIILASWKGSFAAAVCDPTSPPK